MAGGITNALIQSSSRAIGQIYADVTIEENHRDEVVITQHPVEQGGIITDHAFKRPAELEIRCGFSNSSAGYEGYVQQQYQGLLALQLARKPFNVYTGKRKYSSMLIRGLSVVTDPHSEYVLMASVSLQEIITVSTQATSNTGASGTGTSTTTPNTDTSQQANPSATADITNRGDQAGIGTGSQSFAGAFNPGVYSVDGAPATTPSFTASMDGISPPSAIGNVGPIVEDGTGEVLAPGSDPSIYNPFATGAFGGT